MEYVRFLFSRLRDTKTKQGLILNMSPKGLAVLAVMARLIRRNKIPIMQKDYSYFEKNDQILKVLASSRVTFKRKRSTLITHRALLDRMLRPFYLHHAERVGFRD